MGDVPQWVPWANLALNLFIIPLLKVMWGIRVELTRLNGRIQNAEDKLKEITERHHDIDRESRNHHRRHSDGIID